MALILFSEVTIVCLGHSEAHSLKSGVHMFFICMHNNQLKYRMAVFYYTGPSIHVIFPMRKLSEQGHSSTMKQFITANSTHY